MWANKKNNKGFTIVETLIFLAVSSVLFIVTSMLVSGQVERYRVQDAAIRLETNVRDSANDVTTGYYPETGAGNYQCPFTGVNDSRGTNLGCVLAGKRITFDQNSYTVDTMAALASTTGVTQTSDVRAVTTPALTETKPYPSGMKRRGATSPVFYILNTIYSAQIDAATSEFVSGGQQVKVFTVSGTNLQQPTATNSRICFDNGSNRSSIYIGENGGLAVRSELKDASCP